MRSDDEVSAADTDALGELERDREQHSRELAAEWSAKLTLAKSTEEIKALNAQITPAVKKHFTGLTGGYRPGGSPAGRPAAADRPVR
jgi:hypothetical protein